jgi:hypothetical protein
LRNLGVEAKAAQAAAANLVKTLGDGARASQADIHRLASGLKDVGKGARGGGLLQRATGIAGSALSVAEGFGLGGLSAQALKYGARAAPWLLPVAGVNALAGDAMRTHDPEEQFTWGGYVNRAWRRVKEGAIRGSEKLPLVGHLFSLTPEAQALHQRDALMEHARQSVGLNAARRDVAQRRRLAEEEYITEGRRAFGIAGTSIAARRQSEQIAREGIAFSEAAQERARMTGRDPREAAARVSYQTAGRQQGVEQAAQLKQLEQERVETTARLAQRQKEVEQATRGVANAERAVSEAGITIEERERRRLLLLDQLNAKNESLADLQRLQGKAVQQQVQKQQLLLSQSEARQALAGRERDRLTGVIGAERDRIRGVQTSFGRLTKPQQARAAQIAKDLAAGKQVNRESLNFLRGVQGAEKLVEKGDLAHVDQKAFAQFAQATSLNRPLKEAEQARVAIDNKIQVELNLNAESVAAQLEKTLLPQIMQALTQLKLGSQTALQQLGTQQQTQLNAMAQH